MLQWKIITYKILLLLKMYKHQKIKTKKFSINNQLKIYDPSQYLIDLDEEIDIK